MAMTPEQQALMNMQGELDQTRAQVVLISQQHDALRAAHDALNQAAQSALQQRANEIAQMENHLKGLIFRQQFDLLDAKDLKPDSFKGRKTENFKPWAKKFRAYCNSKRGGFRKALEWAEKEKVEIQDVRQTGWEFAEAADAKLYDYLLQILEEDALMLVEKHELQDRGFEAWRLLVQQYEPSGGAYELDAMMALMSLNPCRDMAALPGAVAKFERDYKAYERRSGHAFPQEWKAPAFLRMLPRSHAADMRWKFSQGLTNYNEIVASVLSYTQHMRFDGAHSRGDNDMQCDSAEFDLFTQPWLRSADSWEEWSRGAPAEERAAGNVQQCGSEHRISWVWSLNMAFEHKSWFCNLNQ